VSHQWWQAQARAARLWAYAWAQNRLRYSLAVLWCIVRALVFVNAEGGSLGGVTKRRMLMLLGACRSRAHWCHTACKLWM